MKLRKNILHAKFVVFSRTVTETEIQQFRREIEKDEIDLERVDALSEMSYGVSSGTETVREQACDLDDYLGGTLEDHTKNPIHQRLIEIMHEGVKGDIPLLPSRDINLVTKHVNEVNEVLKCIPVRNLSDLKYVARAGALLVYEKVGVKKDQAINKEKPFWKWRIEKDIAMLRRDSSRIDDWFKRRWKDGSTKLKCELKKKYKIKAKGFNTVIEELKQRTSAVTSQE